MTDEERQDAHEAALAAGHLKRVIESEGWRKVVAPLLKDMRGEASMPLDAGAFERFNSDQAVVGWLASRSATLATIEQFEGRLREILEDGITAQREFAQEKAGA